MGTLTRMSSEGHVTIPTDVREALGLRAGEPVVFERNAAGEMIIRKAGDEDDPVARRVAEMRDVSRRFAHLRDGRPTDAIMREIRGDDPFPP